MFLCYVDDDDNPARESCFDIHQQRPMGMTSNIIFGARIAMWRGLLPQRSPWVFRGIAVLSLRRRGSPHGEYENTRGVLEANKLLQQQQPFFPP